MGTTLYDRNCRPVCVGDVLKIRHGALDNRPNKITYTYNWVTGKRSIGSSIWFVINHLQKVSLSENDSYCIEATDGIDTCIEILQGFGEDGLEPFLERKQLTFN